MLAQGAKPAPLPIHQVLAVRSFEALSFESPRWTFENRPYVDTSKPANGAEPEQEYLYLAAGLAGKQFLKKLPGSFILT
jgi:hypothetical protein